MVSLFFGRTEDEVGNGCGPFFVEQVTRTRDDGDTSASKPRRDGVLLAERHRAIVFACDEQRLGIESGELGPERVEVPAGHHREHRTDVLAPLKELGVRVNTVRVECRTRAAQEALDPRT
jgi:hypothetical protein